MSASLRRSTSQTSAFDNLSDGNDKMLTIGLYAIADSSGAPPRDLHDHSLAFMSEGKLLSFLELERISRIKHDNRLPWHLEELLDNQDFDLPAKFRVVFVDSFDGRKVKTPSGRIRLAAPPSERLPNAPELAQGHFLEHDADIYVCSQELAHLGSLLPFCGGYQENSLLIHIDGGASISNCSAWSYRHGKIRNLGFSWELKPATANFNHNPLSAALLGMPPGSDLSVPGKLMGFASYGQPHAELKSWLKAHNWFHNLDHDVSEFRKAAASDFGWRADELSTHDQFLMDIAACMQQYLEEQVEDYIFHYQERTGARHLYYAGGVALNIRLNSRLENSGRFESVHIPPCANDSGLALGAASLLEFLEHGEVSACSPFLNSFKVEPYRYAPQFDVRELASLIAGGAIVGVCVGNAEIGPRALGHRSLLAKPSSLEIRDRLSTEMKRREWYRPVAPIVLRSEAEKLFVNSTTSNLSRYMLGDFHVRQAARDSIQGVVHVDGSARAQVIDEDDEELRLVIELLKQLRDAHAIPCLINTSFNQSGEPIVHTHGQALHAGWAMGADALVLDNRLVFNPDSGPRRPSSAKSLGQK
jgi:carbamoyltransferase